MTPEQNKHMEHIVTQAKIKIRTKYSGGAVEYGSNLWDMPPLELLENAIEEAADQLAYLITLRDILKGVNNDLPKMQ